MFKELSLSLSLAMAVALSSSSAYAQAKQFMVQNNGGSRIQFVEGATALRPNEAVTVQVHGRFSIHGVTRELTTTARVRYIPLTPDLARTPGITGDVCSEAARTTRPCARRLRVPPRRRSHVRTSA